MSLVQRETANENSQYFKDRKESMDIKKGQKGRTLRKVWIERKDPERILRKVQIERKDGKQEYQGKYG